MMLLLVLCLAGPSSSQDSGLSLQPSDNATNLAYENSGHGAEAQAWAQATKGGCLKAGQMRSGVGKNELCMDVEATESLLLKLHFDDESSKTVKVKRFTEYNDGIVCQAKSSCVDYCPSCDTTCDCVIAQNCGKGDCFITVSPAEAGRWYIFVDAASVWSVSFGNVGYATLREETSTRLAKAQVAQVASADVANREALPHWRYFELHVPPLGPRRHMDLLVQKLLGNESWLEVYVGSRKWPILSKQDNERNYDSFLSTNGSDAGLDLHRLMIHCPVSPAVLFISVLGRGHGSIVFSIDAVPTLPHNDEELHAPSFFQILVPLILVFGIAALIGSCTFYYLFNRQVDENDELDPLVGGKVDVQYCEKVMREICVHKTPKLVEVQSVEVGVIRYSLVLLVLLYVGGYLCLGRKVYQLSDVAAGSVQAELVGNAWSRANDSTILTPLSTSDLAFPSKERQAMFITTAFTTTLQTRGRCAGRDRKTEMCENECVPLRTTTNGLDTGVCSAGGSFCELHSWCPLVPPDTDKLMVQSFTDLHLDLRTEIRFPRWNTIFSNTDGAGNSTSLFKLSDILAQLSSPPHQVLQNGALVLVNVAWDCDLDQQDGNSCSPNISFTQLDNPDGDGTNMGFSFKYSHYFSAPPVTDPHGVSHIPQRQLHHVWGIRFIFAAAGVAHKTDPVAWMQIIGSTVALLGVSVLVADFFAKYFTKAQDIAAAYGQAEEDEEPDEFGDEKMQ